MKFEIIILVCLILVTVVCVSGCTGSPSLENERSNSGNNVGQAELNGENNALVLPILLMPDFNKLI